jgi:hypothetical protein
MLKKSHGRNLHPAETLNKLDSREIGNATAPTIRPLHQATVKLRDKPILVLNLAPRHENTWDGGGIPPRTHNLGIKCR